MSAVKRVKASEPTSVNLRFTVGLQHSLAAVYVATGTGSDFSRRNIVDGVICIGRVDLHGESPVRVTELLCDRLLSTLHGSYACTHGLSDHPRDWTIDQLRGPGAPASGATGAVQDPPPGMPADSGTPGGVDSV